MPIHDSGTDKLCMTLSTETLNDLIEPSNTIKIIDIIDHRGSKYLILNRKPDFKYKMVTDYKRWLIAEDSGFFNFYYHSKPSTGFYAFGGCKFKIPLTNGDSIDAEGQWWHGIPDMYRNLTVSSGYGLPDKLAECNVFCSVFVLPEIVDRWLRSNTPSNNYDKYNIRSENYMEHII